nr:MAG TPA: hypothetical protein [Caudoviricetes sp.]
MCQFKSCLVLKDRVFCPDYNSHQSMLKELGIKDDYLHASKTFVRVELTPPDNTKSLMEPLDRWTLKVDQDIVPEWWDEKADRQRVEEAVEAWCREHVFAEGEHVVGAGEVYAFGNAIVSAYGNAMVTANDNAEVRVHDCAKIYAFGSATVRAWDNATVKAYGSAAVEACGSVKVEAYDNATVEAYDNAKVLAYDNTKIEAWSRAAVKAYDNAIVTYPQQRKAVYPIGWTVEIHE